jgi:hypothetical protein
MRVKRLILIAVASLVVVICVVLSSTVYRKYFFAIGWHLRHGNHTVIEGRRVTVPLFWWREDFYGGGIGLIRATPRVGIPHGWHIMWYDTDSGLEWQPIADRQRSVTDEDAMRATLDAMKHPVFSEPKYADVVTLVTIKGRGHPIYCRSEATTDFSPFVTLDCRMAGSSLMFSYMLDPDYEKTAEKILSTME